MVWLFAIGIGLIAGWISAAITRSSVAASMVVGLVGSIAGLLAVTALGLNVHLGHSRVITGPIGDILASAGGAVTLLVIWSQVRPWLPWAS